MADARTGCMATLNLVDMGASDDPTTNRGIEDVAPFDPAMLLIQRQAALATPMVRRPAVRYGRPDTMH